MQPAIQKESDSTVDQLPGWGVKFPQKDAFWGRGVTYDKPQNRWDRVL